jgi:hypothetical protein
MKWIIPVGVALVILWFTWGDSRSQGDIAKELVGHLRQVAAILEGVNSEQSATAAADQIDDIYYKITKLTRDDTKSFGKMSDEELEKRHGAELREIFQKIETESARIKSKYPSSFFYINKSLMKIQSIN